MILVSTGCKNPARCLPYWWVPVESCLRSWWKFDLKQRHSCSSINYNDLKGSWGVVMDTMKASWCCSSQVVLRCGTTVATIVVCPGRVEDCLGSFGHKKWYRFCSLSIPLLLRNCKQYSWSSLGILGLYLIQVHWNYCKLSHSFLVPFFTKICLLQL